MYNKKVAGTIIMNCSDGTKKFLVRPVDDELEFATGDVSDEMTGLASILKFFKEKIHIDVASIDLVELINVHTDEGNVPLFVFETEQEELVEKVDEDYTWESPSMLSKMFSFYEVAGVPLF